MELIKKIKQAEAEAQEIVRNAKAEAAKQAEEGQDSRSQLLAEAEQKRKKAVEAAIAEAKSQGLEEAEKLKAGAEKDRQKLRSEVSDKIASAATKVMDYLRG